MCRIITGNGEIIIQCSANNGPTVSNSLSGIDTQTQHTVIIRIDRGTGVVALQAFQDGSGTSTVNLQTPTPPSPKEGDLLWPTISYEGQSDGAYRINSFTIQERDPN